MDIALLGVPYALDHQNRLSGSQTAARFRAAGLAERLSAIAGGAVVWTLVEPPLPEGTSQEPIVVIMRTLGEAVAAARRAGYFPVVVGGDCMSSLGVVAGLQAEKRPLGVLWFDAHGDFNTPQTTPSGFLGGMPLAMLVGRGEQSLAQEAGVTQPVPEADVVLAGARDLDPLEREALEDSAVTHLLDTEKVLSHPLPDVPLYLHLDVDVLDPGEIRAVDYPAPGGISLETLARALSHVVATSEVAALNLACLNAAKDPEGYDLIAAVGLLEAAIGAMSARQRG
jgi:arginase